MSLTKEGLQQLTEKQLTLLQTDSENNTSLTQLESKLELALCKIYGFHADKGISHDVKAGFEAIVDVFTAGTRYCYQASSLLVPETFVGVDINTLIANYPKNKDQNNAKINTLLGIAYYKGIGVNQNTEIAFQYLRKAAEQNDPFAQTEYGAYLLSQNNQNEAIALLQQAAQQGYADAQFQLGYGISSGQSWHPTK